jgi:lipoprotein-anchoring transpeptidase ErfK/SrfK
MNTNRESKFRKLAIILAITAMDAYAGELRAPADRIVISISDRKLILMSGNTILKIYAVAVGKPSTPSPEGEFTIINHIKNPAWYGPHIVIPPGSNNPLGTRWMGLSAKGYGIHGTNVPSSIGKSASHGCIRMRRADLEELFNKVDVGVIVELRGERSPLLAQTLAAAAADRELR